MKRWVPVVAVALPGLALAVIGLLHPVDLTPATATRWWQLHVLLLPIFPLLAVAIWTLVRNDRGPLAWAARLAAYLFAAFYTGLDTLAGIGAGIAVETQRGGSQIALNLIELGNELAEVGVYAFLAATVLVGVLAVGRDGTRAVPGTVLLIGAAVPFLHGHIYWPVGGLAMVGVGVGCGLLAAARLPVGAAAHPAT
ncbi:hypothetical protein [Pseudonocardia sp. GCM10023141]|uniref:hypothetical protein n=1 Tax=Pseudonocardia sp. GCM10023141 TaxID=3252653 RepID=UPI00361F2312